MKNKMKILVLTLLLISGSVIEAYSSITITFRIARHRDCKGMGWCKWEAIIIDDGNEKDGKEGGDGNDGTGIIGLNERNRIILTINRKTDLSPEVYEKYFSEGDFICEDDFPVPGELLKALNLKESYIIKEGKYPISEKGELLTIEF